MDQKEKFHKNHAIDSFLDMDKEATDCGSEEEILTQPQLSKGLKKKLFEGLFWLCVVVFVFNPLIPTIIFYNTKDPIVFSYSETQKASSSHLNQRLYCKLVSNRTTSSSCKSYDVPDVVDLAWAIAPLFTCRGDVDEKLYALHRNFIGYLDALGIPSITIEAIKINSDQKYQMTRPNMEPYEIQFYIHNCSYLRENLLNVAIRKLNLPWEYMMWIDAHQVFEDPMWIYKGIVLAEKYAAVQLFGMSRRLNPTNTSIHTQQGFISASILDKFNGLHTIEFGNAWILRRELYEKIGYILDECLANGCDVTYNKAAYPEFKFRSDSLYPKYTQTLSKWQNNTAEIFNGSRAYLSSDIYHISHQSGNMPWEDLYKVLEWTDFNIERDVKRDENFAIYFTNQTIAQLMNNVIQNSVAQV